MRDALFSALSVLAMIVVSVAVGEVAFLGHHQTFVGERLQGAQ